MTLGANPFRSARIQWRVDYNISLRDKYSLVDQGVGYLWRSQFRVCHFSVVNFKRRDRNVLFNDSVICYDSVASIIDGWDTNVGELVKWYWQERKEVLGENLILFLLCFVLANIFMNKYRHINSIKLRNIHKHELSYMLQGQISIPMEM